MEQFTLKWNNYYNQISDAFGSLLDEEDLVDVTLSCEGKKVKAHKMLLSACSSYFRDVFKENPCQHPVIVFRNVPFKDLSAIVEFIYKGEVSVAQEQLDSFLATAEMLAIKGLTDEDSSLQDDSPVIKQEPNKQPSRAVEKRKTTETSLLAKKIKSPPTKKRRPDESVGKPPDNLPVVLKVENITFEEDLNLDEGGNNLTEEVVQEFEQTETEEETSNIEEPMMYSKLPKTNDTVADEEMQAEESQPREDNFKLLFDMKKEENVAPIAAEPTPEKVLKSALKSPKGEKEPAALIKSVTIKPGVNKSSKPILKEKEVNLPKGLTVVVRPVLKEQNLNEPICSGEEQAHLRSEEAKTPIDEDSSVALAEDPVSGEEAEEEEPEPPKEPEFDYYGCEVCKTDARPVADKTLLTHKCPICPCVCFCAHLLKEHMRVIHGWFNVQRRFNTSY